jgi:ribosomal protein S18 acetylase RimI-like enzyme
MQESAADGERSGGRDGARDAADPVRVRLDPMTAAEFGHYLEPAIREYADQKVMAGEWTPEESVRLSRRDHMRLLPDGLASADHLLFTARDEATGQAVATLWLALRMRGVDVEAYVYDLEVRSELRGRGYGRATMRACLVKARELHADTVGLHVFGHNATARALYSSMGFEPTNINMSLRL